MFPDHAQLGANFLKNFRRKKCDLARAIFFVIKKSIALNAAARDANDFPVLDQFMSGRRLAVLAKKIVPA